MEFKIDEGIVYVPRWIKQISDKEYGSVETHEDFNEKLNLNAAQGDYNTEVLRVLFTDEDPKKVPHIRYLDKIITDEVTRIDTTLDDHETRLTAAEETISEHTQQIADIISGVQKVGWAVKADSIVGVENARRHSYYGTNYDNEVGFFELPDAIYAEHMEESIVDIGGIYFKPRPNSVDEVALTEAVREKLNRQGITSYEDLTDLPQIAGIVLRGNKTLSDLGIQPAGNYITEIPSEYVTDTELSTALDPYLTTATAASTYATQTALNNLSNSVSTISTNYTRTFINSVPSGTTAKTGDLLVTL